MQPQEIITHGSLVQEDMGKCLNILNSKRWEPTDIKEKYQGEHLPLIFPLGGFKIYPSRLLIKMILKSVTLIKTTAMVESHLPSQLELVKSVKKG